MPLKRPKDDETAERREPVVTIDQTRLHDDLQSQDVSVRRAAVRLAGRLGATDLLAERLATESNDGIREMILTNMARIGTNAIRPLLVLLRSEETRLRNAVIETLQAMGDDVIPELEPLLADPDADIRISVMNVVLRLRSPRAPALALDVIARDPDVNVCAAAVEVLAQVGRPDMADPLRQLAHRFPDQPFLDFAIRAALKQIG